LPLSSGKMTIRLDSLDMASPYQHMAGYNSGDTCHHSLQNILFFNTLSKNIKIKIYKTIQQPVVLYCYDLCVCVGVRVCVVTIDEVWIGECIY
jgi:hypothetical protein